MTRPAAETYESGREEFKDEGAKPGRSVSKEERLRQVVREALDKVPQGKKIAEYYFRGGQSAAEAAGTRQGLEMLLDPIMAAKGAEKLRRIADNSPVDPELLRNLMRFGKK